MTILAQLPVPSFITDSQHLCHHFAQLVLRFHDGNSLTYFLLPPRAMSKPNAPVLGHLPAIFPAPTFCAAAGVGGNGRRAAVI
jgi:hypothetical protein